MDAALWAEIRRLSLREGWTQRRIARHLHVAWRTVERALSMEHHESRRRPPPRDSALDPWRETVRELLARTPDLTVRRIFEELRQRGYAGVPERPNLVGDRRGNVGTL